MKAKMKPLASIAFSLAIVVGAAIPDQVIAAPTRVVCESSNNRINRCSIDTSSQIRLIRQFSDISCDGRWSVGRGYVEVKNGCRGEFASDRNNNNDGWSGGGNDSNRTRVTCESSNGRNNRCGINTNGGVRLVRQLSDTTCYNNWRTGNGYIEVKNGCRGEFASNGGNNWNGGGSSGGSNSSRVTCESNDGRNKRCGINTNGGVRLVRQLSDKTCYGNWSTGNGYVEVRNGCRAEFASNSGGWGGSGSSGGSWGGNWGGGSWNGSSGGSWGGGSNRRVVCESRDGNPNRCPIDTRNQVRLKTRLTPRSCLNNWKTGDGYVEVRNGCSGEFVSD